MKSLILIILFSMPFALLAQAQEILIGKCKYGDPGLGDKRGKILPGEPFVYFIKKADEFFAISGIAHKEDVLRKRTQPLRGELPLLKIFKAGAGEHIEDEYFSTLLSPGMFYWIQTSASYKTSVGTVPIPLHPQEDEEIEAKRFDADYTAFNGHHPFTNIVYPICSYWKY